MASVKLYCITLGATVPGRLIEQHDVLFAAAHDISDLIATFQDAWPQGASVHVDAYREINVVGHYRVSLSQNPSASTPDSELKLFFFNLGGYVQGDMEEYHHKALIVASNLRDAMREVKQTEFYQNRGFKGAESHIDDKLAVDIDDIHVVNDLVATQGWQLQIEALSEPKPEDAWQVGYLSLSKLAKRAASLEA